MSKFQVFSGYDPLKNFKLMTNDTHDCIFLEHEINGKTINISSGTNKDIVYQEKIITDGIINLEKLNHDHKLVIWHNNLISLNNGISLKIKIEKASFFINIVTKKVFTQNHEYEYNIHTETESEELLSKIINYLCTNGKGIFDTNSISLQYPSTMILEKYCDGRLTKEIEDFSPKVKNKKRRRH